MSAVNGGNVVGPAVISSSTLTDILADDDIRLAGALNVGRAAVDPEPG
jgi:hypothetical protein